MKVRRATMDDREALERLLAEVDVLHYDARPDVWRAPPSPDPRIAWMLEGDDRAVFVAEEEDGPAGLLHIMEVAGGGHEILVPRAFAQLTVAVVRAGSRGKGIARTLLGEAEVWARARRLRSIELNVAGFNAGATLAWERLGFETFSRRMEKRLDLTRSHERRADS